MSGFLSSALGGAGAMQSAVASGPLGSILFGDTGPVVLGGVVFQDQEVPASIAWGGAQALKVHKLPGGKRVIDAMGPDDAPISWEGTMFGPDDYIAERSFQLNEMRKSGQPFPLCWGWHLYTVIVREFKGIDEAFQGKYHITCEVLRDETDDPADAPPTLLGEIIGGINRALAIYGQVLNIEATGEAIFSSLGGLQGLAQATPTMTAGDNGAVALSAAVAGVQTGLAAAIVVDDAAVDAVNVAGLVTGNMLGTIDPSAAPAALATVTNTSGAQAGAVIAQGMIGTVGINLAAVAGATDAQAFLNIPAPPPQLLGGNAGKTVITSGGNLFAIAAAELGDATQWYRIAQASGLDDPMLSGVVTLTIPDAIQAPSAGIPTSGVTIL